MLILIFNSGLSIVVCTVISILLVSSLAIATFPTCPSAEQRSSLQPRSNLAHKIECDCTTETRETAPSWEIMCFLDGQTFDITPTSNSNSQDTDQYTSLPVLFTIKYVYSSYIEIHCYESSPNFMPAMFQGKLIVDNLLGFSVIKHVLIAFLSTLLTLNKNVYNIFSSEKTTLMIY